MMLTLVCGQFQFVEIDVIRCSCDSRLIRFGIQSDFILNFTKIFVDNLTSLTQTGLFPHTVSGYTHLKVCT